MLNRIFKTVLLGTFALVISTTFIACEKANDTIGIIIVKDSNGNTVSGATVVCYPDTAARSPQGNIAKPELRKTDVTDANGRAEFTYELNVTLDVAVEKIDGNNIYTGSNVISLSKEKTVTQVVEIN